MDRFECEVLAWDSIYENCMEIAGEIRKSGFKPDVVIAMARGGVVPARNLCDFLGVTNFLSIKVDHWGATASKDLQARLRHPFHYDVKGLNVLLVDDLSDTGDSFKIAVEELSKKSVKSVKTACLYLLETSKFQPDFFAEKREWKWFIFPWNFHEDLNSILGKHFCEGDFSLQELQQRLWDYHKLSIDEKRLQKTLNHWQLMK